MINERFHEVPSVPSGAEIERRCVMLGRAIDPSMDVVAYGFSLGKRKDLERKKIEYFRREVFEAYSYFDGQYDDESVFGERPSVVSPLTTQEQRLIGEVKSRLVSREKPVTLVDFGGGVGFSMIRIAAVLEDEIKTGKAAVVVTNVSFLPNSYVEGIGVVDIPSFILAAQLEQQAKSNIKRSYTKQELAFLVEKQHLVHYLRSTAPELFMKFITLPNGYQYPLAGNIDVLHEKLTQMQSFVPELLIAFLGHALADGAMLTIHPTAISNSLNRDLAERGPSLVVENHEKVLAQARLIGIAYLSEYLQIYPEQVEDFALYSRFTLRKKADTPK